MKNFIFTVILSLSLPLWSIGQGKEFSIPLGKDESFVDRIHLGEKGFIIKTTERLLYYTAGCELIWEKRPKVNYSSWESTTVAAADGATVYNIDAHSNILKKPHYITQIKKDGQVKEFSFEPSREFGKELIAIFCDNENLYYLALDASKEKKKQEIAVLNRFSGTDMSHQRIVLALPEKKDSYWYYLGQYNQTMFLANKSIEVQQAENTITVIGFNREGSVVKNFSMTYSPDKKFNRPAINNTAPTKGWTELSNNDFGTRTSSSTIPGGRYYTYSPAYMAYGTGPAMTSTQMPSSTSSRT